jgi:hypothetical protein
VPPQGPQGLPEDIEDQPHASLIIRGSTARSSPRKG